jgi:hypothetical protein
MRERTELSLDRHEKNVVIIMLESVVGAYFPYYIEEKPELKKKFAGLTYYPNTVSYSHFTAWGSPHCLAAMSICRKTSTNEMMYCWWTSTTKRYE